MKNQKTLNEMFLSLNKIVLKEYGGGLDETASKLNQTAVKAFLLNAKREFQLAKMNLIHQGIDVKKWAMDKINSTDLFNIYEPNQKWGIASNLVLFVSGKPSPFDQYMPQLKEDSIFEEPTTFADPDTARDQEHVERDNAHASRQEIVRKANEILQKSPIILRGHMRNMTIDKVTRADGWTNHSSNGDWQLTIEFDREYIAVYKNKISTTFQDHHLINKSGFYSILEIFHMLCEHYHVEFNAVLLKLKTYFGKQIVDDSEVTTNE